MWNKKQDAKLQEKISTYEKAIWSGSVKYWTSEEDLWIVMFFIYSTVKALEEKRKNQS